MTSYDKHPPKGGEISSQERMSEIMRLFRSIRDFLDAAIAKLGTPDAMTPKSVMMKMSELQSAHMAILKAEEAFYDKCESANDVDEIDFDAIRSEIGSHLDRIRAAIKAESVSKRP